jgi:Protein of unknown function (DUF3617)
MFLNRLYCSLLLFCAVAAASAQTAPVSPTKPAPEPSPSNNLATPPPPIKMGLWENKTTSQISGFTLPPDVVARLQAAGRPIPGGPRTTVMQSCLTPQEWQESMEHMNDPNRSCVISNRKISDGKWSFDMSCTTQRGMTMSGHFEALITDDEHAHGSAHMKADGVGPNGQTFTSEMTFDSHRLSADCGDIQPGSPKIISNSGNQ